jgi:hypothetical protein
MARIKDIVKDIINPWGKQGGLNPQRSDLWQVDLSEAIGELNSNQNISIRLDDIPRYYAATVSLPELKIKPETVRRDSRSYNMPSWDEPLDAIRITFVVDDGGKATKNGSAGTESSIYKFMNVWRSVVRAGRGPVGNEANFQLDANYRINYAFPVYIYLLKGQPMLVLSSQSSVQMVQPGQNTFNSTFEGGSSTTRTKTQTQTQQANSFSALFAQQTGLDVSGIFRLENTWLAAFKLTELAYERSGTLALEATLFAENILQIPHL